MTYKRKQQRHHKWSTMGIYLAYIVVVCHLSITSAKSISSEINVTIDPGDKFALGDWAAHQSLDVSGGTRLIGDNVTPRSISVRVFEYDENGQFTASRPSQFDVESRESRRHLKLALRGNEAGQRRHFRIIWAEKAPEESGGTYEGVPLQIEHTLVTCVVRNQTGYRMKNPVTVCGLAEY